MRSGIVGQRPKAGRDEGQAHDQCSQLADQNSKRQECRVAKHQ
jgi:hypothetical protein